MKQLLKKKKEEPPIQVLSLQGLPNTQQIPIHTFLTTPCILTINVSFSFVLLILAQVHFCYLKKKKKSNLTHS